MRRRTSTVPSPLGTKAITAYKHEMNFKAKEHVGSRFTRCDEDKRGVCRAPGHWEKQDLYVPDIIISIVMERMKESSFSIGDLEKAIPPNWVSSQDGFWIKQLVSLHKRRGTIALEAGRADVTMYKWSTPITFFGKPTEENAE